MAKGRSGPHQKPVLLQKGRRGRSARARSTRTRYPVSAGSTRYAAKSAARSDSGTVRGHRGRMARVRGGSGPAGLWVAAWAVPPPGGVPRDRPPGPGKEGPGGPWVGPGPAAAASW